MYKRVKKNNFSNEVIFEGAINLVNYWMSVYVFYEGVVCMTNLQMNPCVILREQVSCLLINDWFLLCW